MPPCRCTVGPASGPGRSHAVLKRLYLDSPQQRDENMLAVLRSGCSDAMVDLGFYACFHLASAAWNIAPVKVLGFSDVVVHLHHQEGYISLRNILAAEEVIILLVN